MSQVAYCKRSAKNCGVGDYGRDLPFASRKSFAHFLCSSWRARTSVRRAWNATSRLSFCQLSNLSRSKKLSRMFGLRVGQTVSVVRRWSRSLEIDAHTNPLVTSGWRS
jgi:hypothetical protein